MRALTRLARSLAGQSSRFVVVGTIGFLVDAGMLVLLMSAAGLGHYTGRVGSFLVAVVVTWWLNRTFTFRAPRLSGQGRRVSILREFATYVLFQSVGIAINFATYWTLIERYTLFHDQPVLAVAAGSLTAMVFNFVTARWIVFRHVAPEPAPPVGAPDPLLRRRR